jgi:hypothetical protein
LQLLQRYFIVFQLFLQSYFLETKLLDVIIQHPQLLNDIVVDRVLYRLHTVIQQLCKVFLRLTLLIFNLLVHQNLESLQLVVPLYSELVTILADQLHCRVDLLFKLLEQVFVLELNVVLDLGKSLLEVVTKFLDHLLVILLLNYKVLFQVFVDEFRVSIHFVKDDRFDAELVDLLVECVVYLEFKVFELGFETENLDLERATDHGGIYVWLLWLRSWLVDYSWRSASVVVEHVGLIIELHIVRLKLLLNFGEVIIELDHKPIDFSSAVVFSIPLGFFVELDNLFEPVHGNFSVIVEVDNFHFQSIVQIV